MAVANSVNIAMTGHSLFLCSLLILCQISTAKYLNGDCDWSGSGLTEDDSLKIVKQLYLQCIRGQIHWSYPTGAIRITFQYSNSGKDFRACIKPSVQSSGANIYKETSDTLTMLVSDTKPVVSLSEDATIETKRTDSGEIHCFQSVGGKATVFLEAMPTFTSVKHITHIDYALEPLESEFHTSRQDVCKPCNNTEIIRDFCTSDFVIKSRMRDITHDVVSEDSYFDLSISHVFRQRDNIFSPAKHSRYTGTVVMPLRCHARKASGHFLMTGNIVLGEAHLGCAPRYTHARQIAREMTERGQNECDLSSLINYRHGDEELKIDNWGNE